MAIERSKLAAQVLVIISNNPFKQSVGRENYKLPRRNTRAIAILRLVESPVNRHTIGSGSSKTARHTMLFAILVLRWYFRISMQYSRATFGFQAAWIGLHWKTAASREPVPQPITSASRL